MDFVSGCDVEPPVDLDKNDSIDDGLSSSWPENERKKYLLQKIFILRLQNMTENSTNDWRR